MAQEAPRYGLGDNEEWVQPDFIDDNWFYLDQMRQVPEGIFWIRQSLRIDSRDRLPANPIMLVSATAAYELYWDGDRLGSSGEVGRSRSEEVPGHVVTAIGLPPAALAPGDHQIAIRLSSNYISDPQDFRFEIQFIGTTELFQNSRSQNFLDGAALGLGVLLTAAFLFNAIRLPVNRYRLLLAGLACSLVALIVWLDYSVRVATFTYNIANFAELALTGFTLLLYAVLGLVVAVRFTFNRPIMGIAAGITNIALALVAARFLGVEADALTMLGLCALLAGMVVFGQSGTRTTRMVYLGGLSVGAAMIIMDPQDLHLFLAATTILMSAELIYDLVNKAVKANQAEARSERLSVELVKRHIQPHFLANSLSAAIELAETRPSEAGAYLAALAHELRQLSRIVDQPLVPFFEEIRLCKAYLAFMSKRLGQDFSLNVQADDLDFSFPPGVIHTLMENALTHNRYNARVEFGVKVDCQSSNRVVTVSAPLQNNRNSSGLSAEGTGTRYVKARLQESYGEGWSMTAGEENGAWVTRISVQARTKNG